VLQHQNDVGPCLASRHHTEDVRRRLLPSAPLAVEFRNREWVSTEKAFSETVRWLNNDCGGAAVICADDLLHELRPDRQLGPNESRCRLPLRFALEDGPGWAYCRIHRRRGGVAERLLLPQEVTDWQAIVSQAVQRGALNRGPCYMLMGTDASDAPVQNAAAIATGIPDCSFDWAAHRQSHPPRASLTALFQSQPSAAVKSKSSAENEQIGFEDTLDGSQSWATPPRMKSLAVSETLAPASSDEKKTDSLGRKLGLAKDQGGGRKRSVRGNGGLTLESLFAKKQRQLSVAPHETEDDADLAEAIRRSLADRSVAQIL